MKSATRKSAKRARALIAAFGLVYLVELAVTFDWDELTSIESGEDGAFEWQLDALLTLATLVVPLALAFVAPRMCARGKLGEHGDVVRTEWWTLTPWLFAPWALGVLVFESWRLIPWNLLYAAPCDCATIKSVASTHFMLYLAGIVLSGAMCLALWARSNLPTINVWMLVLALATLALTSLGGFWFVAIVSLAIT